jgi:hypothetical protein
MDGPILWGRKLRLTDPHRPNANLTSPGCGSDALISRWEREPRAREPTDDRRYLSLFLYVFMFLRDMRYI